jgi:hypothetical protein
MFDDLTYARTIVADREREANRIHLARLARAGRAVAACCEGRLAAFRRRFAPASARTSCQEQGR